MSSDSVDRSRVAWPRWIEYLITALMVTALTEGLRLLVPFLPRASLVVPYLLLIMAVVYFFGMGAAILATVLGLLAQVYFFNYPLYFFWPLASTIQGWLSLAAFLTGAAVIALATALMQQTKRRIQALAAELERAYEREHRIADTLQSALLGVVPERFNGFAFETLYRAALEEARIGGDFYDVFELDEGRVGIVIGDVSGKGLDAAVQLAMTKSSIRGQCYELQQPAAALKQVNRTLAKDMNVENFATVFLGILDEETKTLIYANAGHSPVVLWRAIEQQACLLDVTGTVLGSIPEAEYGERTIPLEQGDELLLGTDGLYELRCGPGYLMEGLIEIYAEMNRAGKGSAAELVERVVERCDGQLRDDIAILRVTVVID